MDLELQVRRPACKQCKAQLSSRWVQVHGVQGYSSGQYDVHRGTYKDRLD